MFSVNRYLSEEVGMFLGRVCWTCNKEPHAADFDVNPAAAGLQLLSCSVRCLRRLRWMISVTTQQEVIFTSDGNRASTERPTAAERARAVRLIVTAADGRGGGGGGATGGDACEKRALAAAAVHAALAPHLTIPRHCALEAGSLEKIDIAAATTLAKDCEPRKLGSWQALSSSF